MQSFQTVAIHELPHPVASQILFGFARKDAAVVFINRRHETHDTKIATVPLPADMAVAKPLTRMRQYHHIRSVEINVALVHLPNTNPVSVLSTCICPVSPAAMEWEMACR